MKLHVVHGNQLEPNGSMSEEFKERIKKALNMSTPHDVLIVTGGKTRPKFKSEAEVALDFIKGLNLPNPPQILLEEESTTTGENIRFTKNLADSARLTPEGIMVYHRSSVILKTEILYWRLWNECKPRFVECSDPSSFVKKIIENTAMVVLAVIDPYEKNPLWRWYKRRKRNFTD